MEPEEHYMRKAIELATDNVRLGRGAPFGAVIVRDGAILATGANQVAATNDPTGHAEITAIRNACQLLGVFELQGCTLYSSSEPCPMCLGAILWSRLERLVFGNSIADATDAGFEDVCFYTQVSRPWAQRELATVQMLREEALQSFALWTRMQSTTHSANQTARQNAPRPNTQDPIQNSIRNPIQDAIKDSTQDAIGPAAQRETVRREDLR